MYINDEDNFLLYNNPWIILWVILGVVFGAIFLIMIKKYDVISYY